MVGFIHRFYWPLVVPAYWLCALWLLFSALPIFIDGSGPTANLSWEKHPLNPTLDEYRRSTNIRLWFLYPYWFAASAITFMGCGLTPWLVQFWKPQRSHLFLVSSAATLFLLLSLGSVSDLGVALHFWGGGTIYRASSSVYALLKVFVPISLLAGLLALGARWARKAGTDWTAPHG